MGEADRGGGRAERAACTPCAAPPRAPVTPARRVSGARPGWPLRAGRRPEERAIGAVPVRSRGPCSEPGSAAGARRPRRRRGRRARSAVVDGGRRGPARRLRSGRRGALPAADKQVGDDEAGRRGALVAAEGCFRAGAPVRAQSNRCCGRRRHCQVVLLCTFRVVGAEVRRSPRLRAPLFPWRRHWRGEMSG